jgi:hypothetical protein
VVFLRFVKDDYAAPAAEELLDPKVPPLALLEEPSPWFSGAFELQVSLRHNLLETPANRQTVEIIHSMRN